MSTTAKEGVEERRVPVPEAPIQQEGVGSTFDEALDHAIRRTLQTTVDMYLREYVGAPVRRVHCSGRMGDAQFTAEGAVDDGEVISVEYTLKIKALDPEVVLQRPSAA